MRQKKYKVWLTEEERKALTKLTRTGKHPAQMISRAKVLLELDESQPVVPEQTEIAAKCNVSTVTIYKISKQYAEGGIEATLVRKKRETPPIRPIATGEVEARIIALACGQPPEGRSRWTLRLLEEKVVELGIVPQISDNTIGRLLKKHRLNHT